MKTYLLRDPKTVEPQNPPPNPRRNDPAITATVEAICGSPARVPPARAGRALFIGLDVHNDSIAVSLAPSGSTEVRRYGIIGGQHDDVLRLIKKLAAAHPGVALKFCYEAGPRGYPLCRFLRQHGAECIIVAPSKVPRQPGDLSADRQAGSRPTGAMPINWRGCFARANSPASTCPIRRTKPCGT